MLMVPTLEWLGVLTDTDSTGPLSSKLPECGSTVNLYSNVDQESALPCVAMHTGA